jgi:HSP20 family molecular chaperone IbpA
MANIIRRGSEPRTMSRPSTGEWTWDPFRVMRDLMRWDPFAELEPVSGRERAFAPRFDVKETNSAYVFRADLPGVKESDLDISLTGNQLRVSGERSEERVEESDRSYVSEVSYGELLARLHAARRLRQRTCRRRSERRRADRNAAQETGSAAQEDQHQRQDREQRQGVVLRAA